MAGKVKHPNHGGYRPNAGRPPFEPTDEQRRMVEGMVGFGITIEDISKLIINPQTGEGIAKNTLMAHFRREIDQGAVKANAKVSQTLLQQATGGGNWKDANVTAGIWWTKCRMGWRETMQHEIGPPGSFSHLSDEELTKLIRDEAKALAIAFDAGEGDTQH